VDKEMFTPDPLLVAAVQAVSRRCDGASSNDGQGFNGTDTKYGKALANSPAEVWSDDVQYRAWKMLRKYAKQLKAEGIDYDSIPEPNEGRGSGDIRAIDVRNGKVLVFLPYGDRAYPKAGLEAFWNGSVRGWQVSVSKYGNVLSWAERNGVPTTNRAKQLLAEIDPNTKPEVSGTATLRGNEIVLRFDYNPTIVDAVRMVPSRRWDSDRKEWLVAKEAVAIIRRIAQEHNLDMSQEVQDLPDLEISGTGVMVTVHDKMFALSFPYDSQTISQVRQMPGATWSPSKRAWLVPIESSDEVLKFAEQHKAQLSPETKELLNEAEGIQAIIDASQAKDAKIWVNGLGDETYQPFPFQRAGIAYAMRAMGYEHHEGEWTQGEPTTGGVLIGDEMGLGKTVQGIGVLQAAQAFPAVVVCPASLKLNWERESDQCIHLLNNEYRTHQRLH
jgi:hypothetical protein